MARNNSNQVDHLLWRIIEIGADLTPDQNGRIRLPAERELADLLKVPRPTLRERLAVLETMGFIERAQGSGTYLTFPRPVFLQVYFDAAWRLGFISIEELQRAQLMLVREIAALAATQRVAEDLKLLGDVLARMRQEAGSEELLDAHHEFYRSLALSTRNPVILLLIEGLSLVLRRVTEQNLQLIRMVPGAHARNLEAHARILAAIENSDPDLARIAIDDFFRGISRERGKVSILYSLDT
jgi:GntR family transcriptional regulator, transcriptional repressor for pyruvate dehydrogenase complex